MSGPHREWERTESGLGFGIRWRMHLRRRPQHRRVARFARRLSITARYGGNRFTCPLCEVHLRRFAPYNDLPDRACPNCGGRARHRLLWLYIQRELGSLAEDRVLHVSPQRGVRRRVAAAGPASYTSVDLVSPDTQLRANLEHLPLAGDSIDLLIVSHVLEHVADDRLAAREINRVLRPGSGIALVLVPVDYGRQQTLEDRAIASPDQRTARYGQADHVRLYGKDLAERLAESGLVVQEIDYISRLTPDERRRFGIKPDIIPLAGGEARGDVIHACRVSKP